MSWQRIDENTYIDDSLVTCVEYQLFIDEMREQGKYYQPDHWTSYQFLDGQAHEPILGVRFSDALAFCNWLSQREYSMWNYRLPTSDEAKRYELSSSIRSNLGYWIMEMDDELSFFWIGDLPVDADILNLSSENPRMLHRDIDFSANLAQALLSEMQTPESRLSILQKLINLYTLRERIAGRSSAFEGIRLVKERIK